MAISQPVANDFLNSPDHSLSHRVFANDNASPAQALIVDASGNTTASGTFQSATNHQTNVSHIYGGFQNVATTIACTLNTWAKITNGTSNLWVIPEAVDASVVADNIIINKAGDYIGHLSIAISGGNNDDFFIRCMNTTTNVQQGYIIGTTTSGAANYSILSLPLYLENVAIGDNFQFQVENISNNDDPVVRSSVFYISYLHD